jgi:hypothetical protein
MAIFHVNSIKVDARTGVIDTGGNEVLLRVGAGGERLPSVVSLQGLFGVELIAGAVVAAADRAGLEPM